MRKIFMFVLGVCLIASFAIIAAAQENFGSIQGSIRDPKGAAIVGAEVTATSPALVRPQTATTDGEGRYMFPSLPAGLYSVTASASGFTPTKKEDINVVVGSQLKLDLELQVGGVAGTVTVTSGSEAIDVTTSKTSTN